MGSLRNKLLDTDFTGVGGILFGILASGESTVGSLKVIGDVV